MMRERQASSSSLLPSSSMSPGSERSRIAAAPGTCRCECGRTGGVPAAAVAGRLAAPQHAPTGSPRGGASSGSGTGLQVEVAPEVDDQQPIAVGASEVAQHERRRRRAPRRPAADRAAAQDHGIAAPQLQSDRGAARTSRRWRSRSPRSSLQRSKVSSSTGDGSAASTSGSRHARKLRQELPPPLRHRRRSAPAL